jgi:tRNA/tmRNA/rRNA uracil-C5-methylase (TrmA/RlmC/RlmD family)
MNDYILYISLMAIGACIWNVWAYTKYLETKNAVLLRMLKEKRNDPNVAAWTGDSGTTPE